MRLVQRIFVALVIAVFLATAVVAQEKNQNAPTNGSGGGPQLTIESLTHDFGEVKAGQPLRYSFKVKNTGTADLTINSVTPG
jgi:uncharacterized protein DUF1573